ncbi:MAG: hypothetical protein AAFQ34_09955 [Pseudomonadota bacterium]
MHGPIIDVDAVLRNFPFGELKQLFHLYLAWMYMRKKRFARARKRLDLAIASTPEPSAFVLAFDGLLMIGEGRLKLARARFEESSNLARKGGDADDDYIAKYCALWLAIYNEEAGWDEIKDKAELRNAAWSNASRMLQIYLPRSPLDSLEEICGHRVPKTSKSTHQNSISTKTNIVVNFKL